MQTTTDFHNGESLPTFLEGQNVTVIFQQVNTTEVITIQSPGSAGHILTPPNYACNVSMITWLLAVLQCLHTTTAAQMTVLPLCCMLHCCLQLSCCMHHSAIKLQTKNAATLQVMDAVMLCQP